MAETHTYDLATATGMVRLLLNDIGEPWVFTDQDIDAFLSIERGSIKRAAAQAIDSQATNEALASKVITDHDVSTDGAKLADAMRKHAAALRAQATAEESDDDDAFYFGVVDLGGMAGPEHTNRSW